MRGFSLWRRGAGSHIAVLISALTIVGLAVLPSAAAARRHHRRHVRRAAHGCANTNVQARRSSTAAMRAAVVCLVNQQRAAHGLPGLHASAKLNRSAQGWTNAMIGGDFFSHGSDFAARISAAGFIWSSAGENIATGYATPRRVVNAWMASTGHCENILNPSFRDVGTGVSASGLRGYGTGGGTWTEDFALPMGQRSLSGNSGPMHRCPY
jgi:uncharacterized protein YkwD